MTTDNRTNEPTPEQIVSAAIYDQILPMGWVLNDAQTEAVTSLAVAALRAHGLLVGDTTEARIAEAAKLHQRFVAPNGFRWCSGCSTDEYPEDWPCPTAVALGLNDGENDE